MVTRGDDEQGQRVIEGLAPSAAGERLCHGDVNWSNVHVATDRTQTMLDLDLCGMGWRSYDLAILRSVVWTRRGKQTLRRAFVQGYHEVRTLPDVDVRATAYSVASAISGRWV